MLVVGVRSARGGTHTHSLLVHNQQIEEKKRKKDTGTRWSSGCWCAMSGQPRDKSPLKESQRAPLNVNRLWL
jgi:hypothetical protein